MAKNQLDEALPIFCDTTDDTVVGTKATNKQIVRHPLLYLWGRF